MTAQPPRSRKIIKILGGFLVLAIGLALLLWITRGAWLPLPGRWLVVADALEPAAAVVALAGSAERTLFAIELFNQGYAGYYVASDVPLNLPGLDVPYRDLVKEEAIAHGVPEERVVALPVTVETTVAEAQALRQLAEEQAWPSLLVVTDPYHTRRTRRILDDVFEDSGIRLTVRPVANSWYQPDSWWQSEPSIRETWTEYAKLGLYLAGYQN